MTKDFANQRTFSLMEEIWHAITHGIGALLGITALVLLVIFASLYGNAWHIVSAAIYGSALVILYTSSTLYHGLTNEKVKKVFHIFDHASIYLLIAGTYTPFALVTLNGLIGWVLFGIIWTLAIIGVIFKVFFTGKYSIISAIIYVLIGWLIVLFIKPLLANLALGGVIWLVAGGLAYTGGIIFFTFHKIKYFHFVWHLFVLLGSICHFFSILFYVIPLK